MRGRKRIGAESLTPEDKGKVGATGVNYTIKIPLALVERIEAEIYARTIENYRKHGAKGDASPSAFFREAAELLLDKTEHRRAQQAKEAELERLKKGTS